MGKTGKRRKSYSAEFRVYLKIGNTTNSEGFFA